jgi:hypothetical protein
MGRLLIFEEGASRKVQLRVQQRHQSAEHFVLFFEPSNRSCESVCALVRRHVFAKRDTMLGFHMVNFRRQE